MIFFQLYFIKYKTYNEFGGSIWPYEYIAFYIDVDIDNKRSTKIFIDNIYGKQPLKIQKYKDFSISDMNIRRILEGDCERYEVKNAINRNALIRKIVWEFFKRNDNNNEYKKAINVLRKYNLELLI